jgi:hypothetical protein
MKASVKHKFIPAIVPPKMNSGKEPFRVRNGECGVRNGKSADYADCTDLFSHLCHPRNLRIKLPVCPAVATDVSRLKLLPRRNNERTDVRCYVFFFSSRKTIGA